VNVVDMPTFFQASVGTVWVDKGPKVLVVFFAYVDCFIQSHQTMHGHSGRPDFCRISAELLAL